MQQTFLVTVDNDVEVTPDDLTDDLEMVGNNVVEVKPYNEGTASSVDVNALSTAIADNLPKTEGGLA